MTAAQTSRRLHGPMVKHLRVALGISLRQFARDIGRDSGYLSRVEAGRQHCSPATICKIAERLCVSVDDLTYGAGKAKAVAGREAAA